jgi:hypothetical protein
MHAFSPVNQPRRTELYGPATTTRTSVTPPPVIGDIDLSAYAGLPGQLIRVRAVDDFGVVSVAIVITGLGGAVLEQGDAIWVENVSAWAYAAQAAVALGQTVVVKVTAMDRPGNKVTKTVDHALH